MSVDFFDAMVRGRFNASPAADRSRRRTLLQSAPSGSIRFRADMARPIGTCVNWWFQKPTTMSVRPLMPACTALCPSSRQNAESCAVAGTLLIA